MSRGQTRCCAMAMDEGERIAQAALAQLGHPFRPQGRGHAGFDCLGLVLHAIAVVDSAPHAPRHALRGHSQHQVLNLSLIHI